MTEFHRRVTPAEIVARIRARNEAQPGAEPNRRATDVIARLQADIALRRAQQAGESVEPIERPTGISS